MRLGLRIEKRKMRKRLALDEWVVLGVLMGVVVLVILTGGIFK